MKLATLGSVVLIAAMSAIAPAAHAQQTSDSSDASKTQASQSSAAAQSSTATPTAASSAAKAKPDVPSADVLKKARAAGYHTSVKRGTVYYCKDVVETGTRFSKEVCVDENQLAQTLIWEQAQRDQFSNHTCTGCSGK